MGKSTISMAIFNSKLLVHQRVSWQATCYARASWRQSARQIRQEDRHRLLYRARQWHCAEEGLNHDDHWWPMRNPPQQIISFHLCVRWSGPVFPARACTGLHRIVQASSICSTWSMSCDFINPWFAAPADVYACWLPKRKPSYAPCPHWLRQLLRPDMSAGYTLQPLFVKTDCLENLLKINRLDTLSLSA